MLEESTRKKIVLGTAGLAGIWGPVDYNESIRVIHRALDIGINQFDTAPAYADAEELLSHAISIWKGPKPIISTKVGKVKADDPDSIAFDYSKSAIEKSLINSLNLFSLECMEIVFLHDPGWIPKGQVEDVIDFLLTLKQRGMIKHLGIGGNYPNDFTSHALSGCFDHFMGFNRYNIIKQDALKNEFPALKTKNIQIWQASPLYMGLLGSRYQYLMEQKPDWIPSEDLIVANELYDMAKAKGISMPGLALNFVMLSDCIDKVVIGASNMTEFEQTIEYLQSNTLIEEALMLLKRI